MLHQWATGSNSFGASVQEFILDILAFRDKDNTLPPNFGIWLHTETFSYPRGIESSFLAQFVHGFVDVNKIIENTTQILLTWLDMTVQQSFRGRASIKGTNFHFCHVQMVTWAWLAQGCCLIESRRRITLWSLLFKTMVPLHSRQAGSCKFKCLTSMITNHCSFGV